VDIDPLVESYGDVVVVRLDTEELDARNAREVADRIGRIFTKGKQVILDMADVRFVDSSGCGAILSCFHQLQALDGELKLTDVQKPVRQVFELLKLHRIVEIHENRESAIRSCHL
jgi:anti-sigma B factor antagonist